MIEFASIRFFKLLFIYNNFEISQFIQISYLNRINLIRTTVCFNSPINTVVFLNV